MEEGLEWQVGVWNTISEAYKEDVDPRFAPVVEHSIKRASLTRGEKVLDLGTGTGAVALLAADIVGVEGSVLGVDIAEDMLAIARARTANLGATNLTFATGRAEEIPSPDEAFDAIVATLSMMYVIDRERGAAECARVLRPGGRFVAAVWGGPDETDIVRFQATAGSFAPPPPVAGVGPGALADPSAFIAQLARNGIDARVEEETTFFEFARFEHAWEVLAGVTTAKLEPAQREEAKAAVRGLMWPDPGAPRVFSNLTRFIVGTKNA